MNQENRKAGKEVSAVVLSFFSSVPAFLIPSYLGRA
jgi:hypothetical protein